MIRALVTLALAASIAGAVPPVIALLDDYLDGHTAIALPAQSHTPLDSVSIRAAQFDSWRLHRD